MAQEAIKIKKILEAGKIVYPATILDAVKDATKTLEVNGLKVDNPTYGKTVREIIVDNEKVTAAALNDHETRVAALESKFSGDESVDALIEAEKTRAEGAESDLSDRLDVLEGEATVAGSVAEAKKAADDAQSDVDALEELVGTLPEGATASTVVGYAKEVADAEEAARKAQIGELGKVSAEEGAADHTVKSYVDAAIEAVNGEAGDLADRVEALEATHATKEDGSFKTVAEEVNEAVTDLIDGAPAALDTLKEIADWISEQGEAGEDGAAQLVSKIELNAAAISAEQTRAEGAEGDLQDAIDAINNETTGVLATAKSYADSLVKDADGKSLFDASGDAAQALVDAKAYAEGLLKDGENEKYALAGHNHDDAYAAKGYEERVEALEDLVGEDSVADQITAELAKVTVANNASDAVKGVTVTVNQTNGVISKPVVVVTPATVTYTAGTDSQVANLEATANSGNVLDSSAITAIKDYVDNRFSTVACTDTNDYADVF